MNKEWPISTINCAEWQMISGDNEWVFGVKIRGIIRELLAEIYFDPDRDSPQGGWHWMTYAPTPNEEEPPSGLAINYQSAVKKCEKALGIT